jgi:quercetin dioxygenase-like cupin family protein
METARQVDIPASAYRSPYEQWKTAQGLDTIRGFHIRDVMELALKPWAARGSASGVFINLDGTGGFNDTYVLEIPPTRQTEPWRHIFEETIYILQGHGSTTVWIEDGRKQTFEWHERSYFSLPPNAWHQHFNLSGTEPVRYVAMTSAPRIIDAFKDLDFVFNNPYVFKGKYGGEDDYFVEKADIRRTNFVADVLGRTPTPGEVTKGGTEGGRGRGGGTVGQQFAMVNASVRSHSQARPARTPPSIGMGRASTCCCSRARDTAWWGQRGRSSSASIGARAACLSRPRAGGTPTSARARSTPCSWRSVGAPTSRSRAVSNTIIR